MAIRIIATLACALAAPSAGATPAWPPQAERLLIDKSDRTLTVIFADGTAHTLAQLRFGAAWDQGPKRQLGDEKTPEGEYRVLEHRTSRLEYPNVIFLPALYLDYPNEADVAASEALAAHPGGAIMIHGPHPDFTPAELAGDWTDGCAALSREQMAWLMAVTGVGTPVTIRP